MTTPNGDPRPDFVRVGRPAHVVTLRGEPTVLDDRPVSTGRLIRVGRPLVRGTLTFERVGPAPLELALSLRPGADAADAALGRLTAVVDALNAYESGLGGAGFRVDAGRSGVWPGPAVGLVLVPNDPAETEQRLRSVADLLAKTAAGVVVRVVSAADPDRPLYEVAA